MSTPISRKEASSYGIIHPSNRYHASSKAKRKVEKKILFLPVPNNTSHTVVSYLEQQAQPDGSQEAKRTHRALRHQELAEQETIETETPTEDEKEEVSEESMFQSNEDEEEEVTKECTSLARLPPDLRLCIGIDHLRIKIFVNGNDHRHLTLMRFWNCCSGIYRSRSCQLFLWVQEDPKCLTCRKEYSSICPNHSRKPEHY